MLDQASAQSEEYGKEAVQEGNTGGMTGGPGTMHVYAIQEQYRKDVQGLKLPQFCCNDVTVSGMLDYVCSFKFFA